MYDQFLLQNNTKKQVHRNDLHYLIPCPVKDEDGNWKPDEKRWIDFSIELQREDEKEWLLRSEEYLSNRMAFYDAQRSGKIVQKVALLWIHMNKGKNLQAHKVTDVGYYERYADTDALIGPLEGKISITAFYLDNEPDYDNENKDIELFEVLFSDHLTMNEKEKYMNKRGMSLEHRYNANGVYILPSLAENIYAHHEREVEKAVKAVKKTARKNQKKAERAKVVSIAEKLLQIQLEPQQIAEATGLKLEEVIQIQKKKTSI